MPITRRGLLAGAIGGALAPQLAGWRGRARNLPGPLHGASLAGQPFLPDVFGPSARIVVEAAFGADLTANADTWSWYDITADVRQADGSVISISPVGRADETSTAQPAGCTFQVDNTVGNYSRNNPSSRWYPYVRRNTPIRVRVTIDGSSWYTRFQGKANGFTPSWDISANLAVVTVSASGELRRLNQGVAPTKTLIRRTVEALTPLAYWPCSDASGATQAASAVSSALPLKASFGSVSYGSVDNADGTAKAVQLVNGTASGGLIGTVPTGASTTGWTAICSFAGTKTTTGLLTTAYVLSWKDSQGATWSFFVWADTLNVSMVDGGNGHAGFPDGAGNGADAQVVASASVNLFDGDWHTLMLNVTPSGGLAKADLYVDGTMHASSTAAGVLYKPPGGVIWTPDNDWQAMSNVQTLAISDIAVFDTPTVNPVTMYSAVTGYVGETATARITRLCSEAGIPLTLVGSSTTAMGAQGNSTLITLLRECETTDDGVLYDGRGPGLTYTARTSRYNAATALTADMSADPPQVDEPFEPIDDDQRNRNSAQVTRSGGSSATYTDATGSLGTAAIGTYQSQVTVNPQTDSDLGNRAAWEVHKGTVDGLRYPTLSLDLAATPAIAATWLNADVSSRVAVANVTSKATQHPPGDLALLVEGWSEQLSPTEWKATLNCSPFQPWRIGVIEGAGDTAWRIDSSGSTLAAAAAVGATSLSVAVSDGYLWSTSAADYPRDINVGGVQVTVSAVSGAASPQTFTVTALLFALPAGWTVSLWRPPTIAL